MGSPMTLKLVLRTIGTPVNAKNADINLIGRRGGVSTMTVGRGEQGRHDLSATSHSLAQRTGKQSGTEPNLTKP